MNKADLADALSGYHLQIPFKKNPHPLQIHEGVSSRQLPYGGHVIGDPVVPHVPVVAVVVKGKCQGLVFSDYVSVVVVDVLPNGNLVVMGSRTRDISGDIQTINASGIVNPSE